MPLRGEQEPVPSPAPPGANTAHVKILQTYNHPSNDKIKDRSIRETVKLAIMNAKKTIHLEDQYMISLEIASWLNYKLVNEPDFQSVSILTQDDSIAREDLLFPKQMRKKFIDQLQKGLSTDVIKRKIFIQQLNHLSPPTAHHKVHSKIYIIDDELAIIGSANLSSRSMTHDSETAAVIFNDPGSVTNFVSQLKFKENYDPDTNIIPYEPNKNIKDLDVEIIDDLNNLSTAKKIALSLGGPIIGSMIPQVIKTLVTQFKPAIIDIIDPDADNTQPQQEIPEEVKEFNLYYGNDNIKETALETPFLHAEADTDKEYAYKESTEVNDLEATAWNNEFEGWNEDGNYLNEQPDYPTSEQFNYDKEYTSAFTNPSDNEIAEIMEHQAALAKSSAPNTKTCEGRTCWAKEVLNRLSGISLTIDNRLDEVTKKAIADFQAKNNLPVTQRLDAATERALLEADAINRNNGTAMQKAAIELITTAKTKIEDWTKKAVNNKPQYILDSYRDPRKVYAFVLHHMAFKRRSRKTGKYSDPESYLSTGAHFCILFDGRIIQLHPFSRMIWHGHCISPRSVAVEFEGNFPNIKGKWWIDKEAKFPDKDVPTQQQYEAGRFLASYLKIVLGTTHILAHRQSSKDRENDPGPDIWYNVGQWAVEKLGLSDGGPTFKCGDGNPILP
ncbi:MAG: N-acetylmuramoyl-L-alanine amidase, partial [Flavisolibacter sp.]|nr:N-acetylmuramoyl-L-alanine amidase [Flavisolibacter sp.]